MTNVNRMVAVAIQRGQHAIAKMLAGYYRDLRCGPVGRHLDWCIPRDARGGHRGLSGGHAHS